MNSPLFTFGILAYNNYEYIKEAVDSVLSQDYPAIELIINNDGSADFDEKELTEYIDNKKYDNIVNVKINNNKNNIGTVKSVNFICKNASGEYLMLMAADDALFNSNVLRKFVDAFEASDEKTLVMSGRIAMCGSALDDVKEYFPTDDRVALLKRGDSNQIFSKLTHDSFMPTTSTCFKIAAIKETGFYDEQYFIIEDASKFIYLARNGYKFGWIDDFVAARHRDGGISHGNTRNKSESYRRYRFDEILLFVKEILPYADRILPEDKDLMERKWQYIKGAYYKNFLLNDLGVVEYRDYDRDICQPMIAEMKKAEKRNMFVAFFRERAVTVSLKKKIKEIIELLLILCLGAVIENITGKYEIALMGNNLYLEVCIYAIYILCVILLLEKVLSIGIRILWDLRKLIGRLR